MLKMVVREAKHGVIALIFLRVFPFFMNRRILAHEQSTSWQALLADWDLDLVSVSGLGVTASPGGMKRRWTLPTPTPGP